MAVAMAEPRHSKFGDTRGLAMALAPTAEADAPIQIRRPAPADLPPILPEPPAWPDIAALRQTIAEAVRAELMRQSMAQPPPAPVPIANVDRERNATVPLPQTAEAASVIGALCSARRQTMLYGMRLR
jgi:hypothetical protein